MAGYTARPAARLWEGLGSLGIGGLFSKARPATLCSPLGFFGSPCLPGGAPRDCPPMSSPFRTASSPPGPAASPSASTPSSRRSTGSRGRRKKTTFGYGQRPRPAPASSALPAPSQGTAQPSRPLAMPGRNAAALSPCGAPSQPAPSSPSSRMSHPASALLLACAALSGCEWPEDKDRAWLICASPALHRAPWP